MLVKQLSEVYDILDVSNANGETTETYLRGVRKNVDIHVYPSVGPKGKADMVKVRIRGNRGRTSGGDTPTLGLSRHLGGLRARPERVGFVSSGDGALVVLSLTAKFLDMQNKGDILGGDIIVSTHVCPDVPARPHKPVASMDSLVEMAQVNKEELSNELDAALSVDTTEGNWIISTRGFAISSTVKGGYTLRVSESVPNIMQATTGQLPYVYALSVQDTTPCGNDLYHSNSILQPVTGTRAPAIGVAITTEMPVVGCATGATHITDCEKAARLMPEAAKAYAKGECSFYDENESTGVRKLYGDMNHLQTSGRDAQQTYAMFPWIDHGRIAPGRS